jgi:hypothetical protein
MSEYPYEQPPVDRTLKVPHLVFGLLFLGFAGLWALGESGAISGEGVTILGPAVLVLAGVVGLAASLAAGRNRHRRDRVAPDVAPEVVHEVAPDLAHDGDTYTQTFDTPAVDVEDPTQHQERQS